MLEKRNRIALVRDILLPSPVKAMQGTTELLKREAKQTADILRGALRPDRPDPRVAAETDEKRRFEVAMEVAGKTEDDLPEIEKGAGRRFELWAILAVLSLAWIVLGPMLGLGGQTGISLFDLLLPLGFAAFVCAKAFSAAVTLYRIQRRSMVPIREFLRDRQAWLGGQPSRGASLCLAALAAGLGMAAMWPAPALAQATGAQAASVISSLMTNAGAEDLSLEWLRALFPGMASLACPTGGACANGDNDTLQAMMGVFNAALFGLGGFMLAFHTIVGTVATAHEGKVLGQRWHTTWAPIRVVAGTGLLVPVNGYCGLQYIVLFVIVMGYNLANAMWVSYVDRVFSGQMASAATATTPSLGLDLAHSIIASETCVLVLQGHMAGLQRATSGGGSTPPRLVATASVPFQQPPVAGQPTPGIAGQNGSLTWQWGVVCGNMVTAQNRSALGNAGVQTGLQVVGQGMQMGSQVAGLNISGATRTVTGAGTQAGITFQSVQAANQAFLEFLRTRDREVATLVQAVRDSGLPGTAATTVLTGQAAQAIATAAQGGGANAAVSAIGDETMQRLAQQYETIRTAAETFNTNMNAAAQTMSRAVNAQDSAGFQARARALGWASAGGLNTTLLRAAANGQELAADATPTMVGPDLAALARMSSRNGRPTEARQRLEGAMVILQGLLLDVNPATAASPQSVTLGADRQSTALITRIFKPMTDGMARFLTDDVAYINPVRPMSSIQAMGNTMLALAWAPIVTYAGLKALAAGGGALPLGLGAPGAAGGGALDAIGPMVYTLVFAAFVCGALHAYVLPMLPFIMWVYAILATVSVAAELVIAAPAAAFMHIRADGQELINPEQKTIYTMAFNALMRPSLLLCGLIVANLTFAIMANYLNRMYGPAVSATNGDSVIGIVGFLTLTLIIFYLHYQLVVRCMQLISAIPSAVADIIGARDQARDEHGETNRVFAAVANISSRAGTTAANAGMNAMKASAEREKAAGIERAGEGGGANGAANAVRQGNGAPGKGGNRPASGPRQEPPAEGKD